MRTLLDQLGVDIEAAAGFDVNTKPLAAPACLDAIVSVDVYHYFGTDVRYVANLARRAPAHERDGTGPSNSADPDEMPDDITPVIGVAGGDFFTFRSAELVATPLGDEPARPPSNTPTAPTRWSDELRAARLVRGVAIRVVRRRSRGDLRRRKQAPSAHRAREGERSVSRTSSDASVHVRGLRRRKRSVGRRLSGS